MFFDSSLDPLISLDQWVQDAVKNGVSEPNAMTLATVSSDQQPHNRVVLYKGLVRGGLSFYTNYRGQKARDIEFNPKVSVNFFWAPLARQIRIYGLVSKLTREESERYFKSRPRISQLGAWASQQSEEVGGVEVLAARLAEVESRFAGTEVICPPHWGGYQIMPLYFEFWVGREGRLHERYCFERSDSTADWRRFMRFP